MLRVAAMITALLTLTACETAQGFGQDVQKAGAAIEQEAE